MKTFLPTLPEVSRLVHDLLMIAGLGAFSAVSTYVQMIRTGLLGQKALYRIRQDIFNKLQDLPMEFFAVNNSGDIINRLTGDVEVYQSIFNRRVHPHGGDKFRHCRPVCNNVWDKCRIDLLTVAISFLVIIVFLLIQGSFLKWALKRALDLNAQVTNQVQEFLNGFAVTKAYGQEDMMYDKYAERNGKYFKGILFSNAINSISAPTLNLIANIVTVIIVVFLKQIWSRGVN